MEGQREPLHSSWRYSLLDHLIVTFHDGRVSVVSERAGILEQVSLTAKEWQTQEDTLCAAQAVRHEQMLALQIPSRQPRQLPLPGPISCLPCVYIGLHVSHPILKVLDRTCGDMRSKTSIPTGSEGTRVLKNKLTPAAVRPENTDGSKHVAIRQTSLSERLKVLQSCSAQCRARKASTAPRTNPRSGCREANRSTLFSPLFLQ